MRGLEMMLAMLLLGVFPALFLPEMLSNSDEDDMEAAEFDETGEEPVFIDLTPDEDVESNPEQEPSSEEAGFDVPEGDNEELEPIIEDDEPSESPEYDPTQENAPVIEDDERGDDWGEDIPENSLDPVIEDDEHSLYVDGGNDHVEITGFDADYDRLHITLTPEVAESGIDVDVTIAENGTDSEVRIAGTLVVVILNELEVTGANIIVDIAL